jgi:hypothetical protein
MLLFASAVCCKMVKGLLHVAIIGIIFSMVVIGFDELVSYSLRFLLEIVLDKV